MAVAQLTVQPPVLSPHEERLIEAALRCIARWGVAKTTLDDVAREAGMSRATLYRVFPGGKDALLVALVAAEIARFSAAVSGRMAAAGCLEDALVAGMSEAMSRLRAHAALQFVLASEPEIVMPHVAFAHQDDVLAAATEFVAPHLAHWVASEDARRVAEWMCRLVLSYAATPAAYLDVTDEASVRRLVRAFVLPGLAGQVR